MTIETPLRSRLAYAIGGGALVAIALWLTWYWAAVQHNDPVAPGVLVAAFAAMTFFGAVPTYIRADHDTVGLYRVIRRPKTVPRASVNSISLVPAAKGIRVVEIRAADGDILISTASGFTPADLTRLADHLGVPFYMS